MGAIRGLIDIQQKVLNVEVSEDLAADSELRIEIQKMLDGAFGGIQKSICIVILFLGLLFKPMLSSLGHHFHAFN